MGDMPRGNIVDTVHLRDNINPRASMGVGAAGDVPWCNIAEKFHRLGMATLGAATLLRSQHQQCIRQILNCLGRKSAAWIKRVRAPRLAFPPIDHVFSQANPTREITEARPLILADRARETVNSNQQAMLRLPAAPRLRREALASTQLGEHNANAPHVYRKAIAVAAQFNLGSPVRQRHDPWRRRARCRRLAPSKV